MINWVKTKNIMRLTFFAERSIVVQIATLADGPRVRVNADASVLTRILLDAHVELANPNAL